MRNIKKIFWYFIKKLKQKKSFIFRPRIFFNYIAVIKFIEIAYYTFFHIFYFLIVALKGVEPFTAHTSDLA